MAAAQNRITRPIESGGREALRGNVHPLARAQFDEGEAAATMMLYRMRLTFRPSAAQQADLDALLEAQQNPLSPFYHQWLTPEQYADRFALSAGDIAKVIEWLQARGFTVDETSRSRTYVAFSGTVAQAEAAFGTAIHQYVVNGQEHYANVSDPSLPAPLADVVLAINGLNNFSPRPRNGVGRVVRPAFTSSISGSHFLAPDDFATIYNLRPLYNSGIDGTGQKLAVMGQTDLILSDIGTFRSISGLPASTPTQVLVPGSADPGVVNGDVGEANLDVQWAGGVARNAQIIFVISSAKTGNGAFDSLSYSISQNLAPVLSISYGDCEPHFLNPDGTPDAFLSSMIMMAQQANTQGQTIVGPSGDSGAADCDYPPANSTTQVTSATHGLAVDVPAALPYVTGAGGSTFNEGTGLFWTTNNTSTYASAIAYIPETAWNDTAFEIAHGGSLSATGGGVSTLFSKPSWQTGVGVPNDGKRDVPDITFAASVDHDGYLVCSQGSCVNGFRASDNTLTVFGGTSAGSPVFAGIVALINQMMGAPQGNVNPRLYKLAATPTDAIHDITSGDNKVPCTAGSTGCPSGGTIGYSAGVGYDPVTGLGSVDAYNLVSEWGPNGASPPSFTVVASLASASVPPGGPLQYNVAVSPVNGFTGTVNTVLGSLPSGLTATINPTFLTVNSAGSQSATVQVTISNSVTAGTYVGSVTGTSGVLVRSGAIGVSPDFQLGLSPSSMSLTAGTTGNVGSSTLTVSSLNGLNSAVGLSCLVSATLPGTTCTLSSTSVNVPGTLTVTVTAPTTRASLHSPGVLPRWFPWTGTSFALAYGLVIAGTGERASKKKLRMVLLAAVLVGLAMMLGCGGGGSSGASSNSPSTTTATGLVTVQGTSGSVVHTATITVTVN